ncbi:hypothetical protein KMT30_31560 [Streptomyces sp. IBSBF 2953]|uniref:hypothetical protein n=1 Tax=Streptomyces TaxID=1883 RepID=UPI00211A73EF|nr:hypothetical protein [Streptomyces scabiei]MCQ9183504.1 hypothetical protein [Streptomyces hayashii]MDX3116016.1 hypothetical protein [Streptomyces scabiei]
MSIATFTTDPTAVSLKDLYVLHGRQLQPGVRLEDASRYNEAVWRLKPAQLKAHDPALILNFPTLPSRFRSAAKRLFYGLLSRSPTARTLRRSRPSGSRSRRSSAS